MDRTSWIQTVVRFQACARGYLVRNEVRRARKDFEDVVNGTDGAMTHLKWVEGIISLPYFTDPAGPLLQPHGSRRKSDGTDDVSAAAQCLVLSEGGDHCVLVAKVNAEKDDSPYNGPSCPLRGDVDRQSAPGDTGGTVIGTTTEASTTWSPSDVDPIHGQPHKGPRQYRLAQEVPRTSEALHLHRNMLSMEYLWIQQAIDSRKKYLSLKDSVSR